MRAVLIAFTLVGTFGLLGAVLAAGEKKSAALGAPAPQFTLQDASGKAVSLADYKGKIVVLEWLNPGCPVVMRHYKAGTMLSLASKYAANDVVWLGINSTAGSGNEVNGKWAEQQKVPYPVLNDSAGEAGKAYGASNTPHLFIIDKDGKLVYKGAIDDDPSGNKAEKVNYVQKALDELLAGQPVSLAETKAYGCGIKYAE